MIQGGGFELTPEMLAAYRAELQKGKQPEPKPQQIEQRGAFATAGVNFTRGAVGAYTSTARGIGTLLGENSLPTRAAAAVEEALPAPAPGNFLTETLPSLAGNVAGYLTAGVGAAALAPEGAGTAAATITAGAMGAFGNAADLFERVRQIKPDDPEAAWKAYFIGLGLGAAQAIPAAKAFRLAGEIAPAAVKAQISKLVTQGAVQEGLAMALTVGAQTAGNELVVQGLTDQKADWNQVARQTGAAGIVGFLLGGAAGKVGEQRRNTSEHVETSPDTSAPTYELLVEPSNAPSVASHAARAEQPTVREVKPATEEDRTTAAFLAQRGMTARFVDYGTPTKFPASYHGGDVVIDVQAPRGDVRRSILNHEIVHHLAGTQPDAYAALYGDLQRLDPEGLAQAESVYKASHEAAGGGPLEGLSLAEEGAATYAEGVSAYMDRAIKNPQQMARILSEPTMARRVVEALMNLANRFGAKFDTKKAAITDLARQVGELDLSKVENRVRAAQRISQAFEGLLGTEAKDAASEVKADFEARRQQYREYLDRQHDEAVAAEQQGAELDRTQLAADRQRLAEAEARRVAENPAEYERLKDEAAQRDYLSKPPHERYAIARPPSQHPIFPTQGDQTSKRTKLTETLAHATVQLDRMVEHARKSGQQIPDAMNPAIAELRRKGITGAVINKFKRHYRQPIIEALRTIPLGKDTGTGKPTADAYLIARHVILDKVNDFYRKINPALTDGSGISDADAQAILNRAGNDPAYAKLGDAFDAMNKAKLKHQVEKGLLHPADAAQMEATFPHWAPLKTDLSAEESSPGTGSGLSIRGRESQARTGRDTMAEHPIEFAMQDFQRAIVRGEKDTVLGKLYDVLKGGTLKHIATVDDAQTVKGIKNGQVADVTDPQYKNKPNVLVFKRNGEEHVITFHPPFQRIAEILKQDNVRINNEGLAKVVDVARAVTNFFQRVTTRDNPLWMAPNLIKDIATGISLSAAEEGPGFAARVVKHIVSGNAYRAMLGRGPDAGYAREYVENGGKMPNMGLGPDFASTKETLAKDVAGESLPRRLLNRFEQWNDAIENGTRLAAYIEWRKDGMSMERAILKAKELTVNFEKKGTAANWIGAFWAFGPANIAGIYRLGTAAAKNPKAVGGMLGSWAAAGYINAVLQRGQMGQNADGSDKWDSVPEWEKDHSIHLGDYRIPSPPGISFFYNLGWRAEAMQNGSMGIGDAVAGGTGAAVDAFNPLGGAYSEKRPAETLALTATPTTLRPALAATMNVDEFGRKIRPEKYNQRTPDSQLAWPDVSPTAKWLAEELNSASGGTPVKPGAVDVSPQTLEYLGRALTPGVLGEGRRVAGLATKAVRGQDIEARDIPFVRSFTTGTAPHAIDQNYSKKLYAILDATAAIDDARRLGDRAAESEARKDAGPLLRYEALAKKYKSLVDKQERLLLHASDATKPQIEATIQRLKVQFNKRVNL